MLKILIIILINIIIRVLLCLGKFILWRTWNELIFILYITKIIVIIIIKILLKN